MKKDRNIKDKIINSILNIRNEEKNLLKFVNSLNLTNAEKLLDVGCGNGRILRLLRNRGFEIIGVDVNDSIIKSNLENGLKCISASEFNKTNDLYDVILMFHVIEHFHPDHLLTFMDTYLNRLKVGGYLIIATPLNSPYFYEDFDHVKPYHPTGINMVFANKGAQVQYYSQNKIKLIDIWFRRDPFRVIFSCGLYIHKYNRINVLINIIFALLFRLSFGLIGRTDGWMGLYKKVSQ